MSDEVKNPPVLAEEPTHDFSQKDLEVIQAYQDNGLQGIAVVDEQKAALMLEMYLSGKTYRQICTTMQLRKEIVLYMSFKFNWFSIRKEYLQDLEISMQGRLQDGKVADQDFFLNLAAMYRKKIGSNLNKYFATDNVDFANAIDPKEVDKYLKVVDALQKLSGGKPLEDQHNNRPMVGLNAGDGVTIVKKGDNEIEITPKSKAIKDGLKEFANFRREEEKKSIK
ncbi:MAG: hypothetical protein HC840_00020 [Leptolyngbyaceae cyanobacterium RM2_2_4]|nr:hypothetical protein [Leptolyngbyaceae cyanobacterium RM2_2_4]